MCSSNRINSNRCLARICRSSSRHSHYVWLAGSDLLSLPNIFSIQGINCVFELVDFRLQRSPGIYLLELFFLALLYRLEPAFFNLDEAVNDFRGVEL